MLSKYKLKVEGGGKKKYLKKNIFLTMFHCHLILQVQKLTLTKNYPFGYHSNLP